MFSTPCKAVTSGGARVANLIEELLQPDFAHCAPSVGGTVVEVQWDGVRLCDRDTYVRRYPTLAQVFLVEHVACCDVSVFTRRVPDVKQNLRWLDSGGIEPGFNCVECVREVMLSAGQRVPRYVMTPDQLFDWCRERGYEQFELAELGEAPA